MYLLISLFNSPPNKATPRTLPSERINIFAAVAIPRISQGVELCIATIKAVLVIPIPMPIKKDPVPAQMGPLSGDNIKKIKEPITKENPPNKEVIRYPFTNKSRPATTEAIGQPIDIVRSEEHT